MQFTIWSLFSMIKPKHLFSKLSKTLHKPLYILFFNAITTNKAVYFFSQNENVITENKGIYEWKTCHCVWFTCRWSFIPSSSHWSWLNIAGRRISFLKATVLWPKVKLSLIHQSWSSPRNTAAARHKYASAGVSRYSLLFSRSSPAVYRDKSLKNENHLLTL